MTPQEQQLLQGLTDRINQTVLPDKDPEAEQFINQALGRNPDATYILAQTVLVQQYALDQAKQQLDQAKKQLDDAKQQLQQAQQQAQQAPPAPVHHTSFLGSLLGTDDRPAPPPPPAQAQYQPVPNYAPPPPAYAQPQYVQPGYAAPVFGGPAFGGPAYGAPSGGSGFLGSALRTAGGVAAGALAFEGIESLMHRFGEHAGYGAGNFGGGEFGGGQPREEVINNYYGDSGKGEHGGVSRDIEDRRDDNSRDNFADTGTSNDDTGSLDDTPTDDTSNFDDNSASFDDSSSFDDSGSDNNF